MRQLIILLVLSACAATAEAGCRGGRCSIVKKTAKKVVAAPFRIFR